MKIAIGCDHGGYELKTKIVKYLEDHGYRYSDFGCSSSTKSVDYPDIAFPVAEAVASGKYDRGILVCGTGIGVSICANRVKGVRCALCSDPVSAELTRKHNDSNVLALGGRIIGSKVAEAIVSKWLSTEFEGGRHERRLTKIAGYTPGSYSGPDSSSGGFGSHGGSHSSGSSHHSIHSSSGLHGSRSGAHSHHSGGSGHDGSSSK
ncbi:MAG: ribose 5-phosphate isomerase B [Clostridia bacterium]|nr:ribose 5-phosphate isomerase B [Clostridia bacterium]